MAKIKKEKPKAEEVSRRVLIEATDKHPNKVTGIRRKVHPRKAKRLIESGWFKLVK